MTSKYYTVKKIVNDLTKGDSENDPIIIPEYQRDYVWSKSNIPFLLDSLYRGYPIGAITTWRKKEGEIHLLDGLQRSFSLVNISRNFDEYVSDDLISFSFKKEAIELFDEDYWKENGQYLTKRSGSVSKLVREEGLAKALKDFEEAILEQNDRYEIEYFKIIISSLKDIKTFKEKKFNNIEIPRIIIPEDFKQNDVTEIFKRLNSKGKPLNKFEIYSSIWSNYNFDLDVDFVQDFIDKRAKIFSKQLGINVKKSPYKTAGRKISPSDYIYASLERVISKTKFFKVFMLKTEDNITRIQDIETLTYLFLNYFGLKNKSADFEALGEKMRIELNNNEKASGNLIRIFERAFEYVENNIELFLFARSNSKEFGSVKDNLKLSTHMFVSMINQVVNEIKKDKKIEFKKGQLDKWIVYETIQNTYGSSSGTKGMSAVSESRYMKEVPKGIKLGDNIINYFMEKEFENTALKTYSNISKLILVYIQKHLQVDSITNLEVDHVIPKAMLTDFNKNSKQQLDVHSIYNLQLLEEQKNKIKNKHIIVDEVQYDFLSGHNSVDTPEKIDYYKYVEILENIDRGMLKENYIKLSELRKNKIDKIIKSYFN